MFKALWVEEMPGGAYSRRIAERRIEDLPPGDVLLRVLYSSLNYKDALSASGNKGVTRNYPHTPGIDAVGVVEESADVQFRQGELALVAAAEMGASIPGGFGQYVRVPAEWLLHLPAGLTPQEAMSFGTAGFTAAMCVDRLQQAGLSPDRGEILVTGATGGVGTVAVGILLREGYQVIAATGKIDRADVLRQLAESARQGSATSLNVVHRDEVLGDPKRPLLHSRWAGAVDTVGGDYLASAIRAAKPGGVITACGNAASPDLPLTVYPFILRGVSLIGIDATRPGIEERTRLWNSLAGKWRVPLEGLVKEVGLDQLSEEMDKILAGGQVGRILVRLS